MLPCDMVAMLVINSEQGNFSRRFYMKMTSHAKLAIWLLYFGCYTYIYDRSSHKLKPTVILEISATYRLLDVFPVNHHYTCIFIIVTVTIQFTVTV